MQPVGLAVVVGAHDVGVAHPRAVFRFAKEALDGNRVSRQAGAKDLHRRRTTFRVLGAIDGRCAAFADISLEVVSGDSPTDQRVSVHAVAKLVNPRGASKLESAGAPSALDASCPPSLTFAGLQSCRVKGGSLMRGLMRRHVIAVLLGGAALGCGSWKRVGSQDGPAPGDQLTQLVNVSSFYQRLGRLAAAEPLPFVGTVAFAAGPGDSVITVLGLSLENRALAFPAGRQPLRRPLSSRASRFSRRAPGRWT